MASTANSAARGVALLLFFGLEMLSRSRQQLLEKIEIDVADKYRVRVGNGFDGQALRRVLDVLERR